MSLDASEASKTEERPSKRSESSFLCVHCGYTTKDERNFMRHGRIHTGDLRQMCESCGKRFIEAAKLWRHRAQVHKEDQASNGQQQQRHKCIVCQRTFLLKEHLVEHKMLHDPLKMKAKCPNPGCHKAYSRMRDLKKHQRVKHED